MYERRGCSIVKSLPPFSCSSAKASARKARRLPSSASGPHPSGFASDLSLPGPPSLRPSLARVKVRQGGAMWIHIGRCLRIFSRVSMKTSSSVKSQDSRAPCLSRGSHTWCPVPASASRTAFVTPPFPAKSSQKAGPFSPAFSVPARGGAGFPTPGTCGASWPRQFSAFRSPGHALSGCLPRHFWQICI